MLKVSIIIPAYNTFDVINRTLKSVELQTYKNYELVIINDGSTDGTRELLDNYKKDKNNVIVHHQENQGVSAARNKGIELSNGEYICFLDSDDTYDCTFLEKMIKRQNETGCDVIYCGFNEIKNNYLTKKLPLKFFDENIIANYYSDECFIHFSGILASRDLILKNKINFVVGRKISEDILYTVKLFYFGSVACVPEYLHNYFFRENSAINSKWNDEQWLSDIKGNSEILTFLKNNYTDTNKKELLESVRLRVFKREIQYLFSKLLHLKLHEIKNYIDKSDFTDFFCKNKNNLSKSEQKQSNYFISNSYFKLFIGYIYYKFVRFNFKKFKTNKAR